MPASPFASPRSLFFCRASALCVLLPQLALGQSATATPIQHVIVVIAENRSFDHLFATYVPKNGQTISNLLSRGIITAAGAPGPNFSEAVQNMAIDTSSEGYEISPPSESSYSVLPTPIANGLVKAPFSTLAAAQAAETGLAGDNYYLDLTMGGAGIKVGAPDTRILNATKLPPGPFQITPGVSYHAYSSNPAHRFFQTWQELDCNMAYATAANPSGCKADLYAFVETKIGSGSEGKPQPSRFTDATTGEGSSALGFYNMLQGDAPYLKSLADHYAMSDNYHQAAMGGTGVNHIMLGTGDMIWFSDGKGNAATPPHNQLVAAGTANAGVVDEIENPNPQSGTNDWYLEDGAGGGSGGHASYGGGNYTNCSDASAPGVASVLNYLKSLPYHVNPNCQAAHYYHLNNYKPGYFGSGKNAYTDTSNYNSVFTVPPSNVRTIGEALSAKGISWKYYGDHWNRYLADPYFRSYDNSYCDTCNFSQYSTAIMTNPSMRAAHLKDTTDFYSDVQSGKLPAVSYVKPSGFVDGHPGSSKLDVLAGFLMKVVDAVQANPTLWKSTAIFVIFDESGGFYDSGYVQPLDFFGDGVRVPLIVVSPYTDAGHISHVYSDHVSILKFIERNWGLDPLTSRSRDNLPNPTQTAANPYVPTNSPAIGDLFDLFDFNKAP